MGATVLDAPHCWHLRNMIRVALSLSSNVSGLLQLLHRTYLQPKQNSDQQLVKAMLQLSQQDDSLGKHGLEQCRCTDRLQHNYRYIAKL